MHVQLYLANRVTPQIAAATPHHPVCGYVRVPPIAASRACASASRSRSVSSAGMIAYRCVARVIAIPVRLNRDDDPTLTSVTQAHHGAHEADKKQEDLRGDRDRQVHFHVLHAQT